jgi:uncharacterized protein (TIGR00725 family)
MRMKSFKLPLRTIGVIGAGECGPEVAQIAFEVGKEIAARGAILICGGLGGVMAAAAQGARSMDGLTVGFLPGSDAASANPDIMLPIPTAMDHGRNVLIVRSSQGLIAIAGGYGTLSEIALALKMNKPIIGIRSWDLPSHMQQASSAAEAVESIYEQWQARGTM